MNKQIKACRVNGTEAQTGRPLDDLREGGAEHQGLSVLFGWHSVGAHQAAHVGLKAHVQHAVGLVQD